MGIIQGALHGIFPGFLGFGFRRKVMHTKTQQYTNKARKFKRRILFLCVSTGGINFVLSFILSQFYFLNICANLLFLPSPPTVQAGMHVYPNLRHCQYCVQYAKSRPLPMSAATLQDIYTKPLFGVEHCRSSRGGTPT